MATNTRKLAALLGASGAGIADAGTINTAGITADAVTAAKIPAGAVVADIADDAITGAKFANDIAISTTGNIATTGSGTLTSAGAFTASGGIANTGTITAGTLGSSVVFPAGHVIKTYSKTFIGVQTINTAGGSHDADWSTDPSKWAIIGTGASGADGDPLSITTDTPLSSSSKYLLRANVIYSRYASGSAQMKWWHRIKDSGSAFTTIVQGKDNAVAANATRFAFGGDHPSTGSNHGTWTGSGEYLWSPGTTNAYEIQIMMFVYGNSQYINRSVNSDNKSYMGNGVSSFTLQEIAG